MGRSLGSCGRVRIRRCGVTEPDPCLNTSALAVLFQIVGVGARGTRHPFEKPWFTTLQTTMGCALALLTHYARYCPMPAITSHPKRVQCTHPFLGSTRLLDKKWRKVPSGTSDLESMASYDDDVYQPLMPGHEESRRRFAKDARAKTTKVLHSRPQCMPSAPPCPIPAARRVRCCLPPCVHPQVSRRLLQHARSFAAFTAEVPSNWRAAGVPPAAGRLVNQCE